MIGNDPNDFFIRTINAWTREGFEWEPSMISSFQNDFIQKSVIRATCQDFRCFATIDYEEDKNYISTSKQIICPTMVLWGSDSLGKEEQSPLNIWKSRCKNVEGHSIDSGHFLPAENPKDCFTYISSFLTT